MTHRNVWFWKDVLGLLRRLSKESKTPLNRIVNLAVLEFLRGSSVDVEALKLEAQKIGLMREEADIRRSWRLIGRSGSYLESYAAQVLQPREYLEYRKVMRRNVVGAEYTDERRGRVPLGALSKKEEKLFRKMMARREEIADELTEIELKLFELRKVPKGKWRWKFKRQVSRSPSSETKTERREVNESCR